MSRHEHRHENPHAGQGPVVVDVGDDRGAVVVMTSPDMAGAEIEAGLAGGARTGLHVGVLPRRVADGIRHAAVFPSLPPGDWHLWSPVGSAAPAATVTVAAGRVVEATWPPPSDPTVRPNP